MPNSTLIPGDEKQDEQRNVGQQRADNLANRLSSAEKQPGTTDMSEFEDKLKAPSDDSAPSTPNEYGEQARQGEQNPTGAPGSGWDDKTSPTTEKKKFKFSLKRDGPTSSILVIILGLFGIGGTLFTPGLGIVQMKEMLTSNLNDQLSAMDIRSNAVFKSKLKDMSSGVCVGVKIKCKFTSMSQRQIDRFKKAGFVIEDDGVKDTLFGRKKITFMTAPDGTAIRNPADLAAARKNSVVVRSATNRVFSPLYYGLSDKVANTFLESNKTNKQKKVTGETDEERKKSLAAATSGERAGSGGVTLTDEKGTYVTDDQGNRIYSTDEGYDAAKASAEGKVTELDSRPKVDGKAVTGVIGGVGRGLSVLGAADSACTVYNAARAVSAMAKVARSMQLIQFAMVINTTADAIKAGDAEPEEVEFIGNMLTQTDTRKTVYNETTGTDDANPFFGKAAFDSPGYKTAAYNDAPTLTAQSQQYMVGGGLTGTLSGVISTAESLLGGNPAAIRGTCGVVQNPWVRGVGLIAGIIVGIGSFGVGTAVMAGASIAISFALPFIESMMTDIVAGTVVGGDISGVAAGDAAFAGTAATLGGVAQNRGMTPLSKEGIQEYAAVTSNSMSDYIAVQKYDASKTPFDVNNQYSFLGSLTRSLYPSALQAQASAAGALTSVGSIIQTSISTLVTPASAATAYNEARFSQCTDAGYQELGIDADIFCNVRYGLTGTELAMDTEEVVDFMLSAGYINNEGVAQNDYATFMKNCANRKDGWGDTSEENGSIGLECIDGSGQTLPNISYFRIYTMDASINAAMDDEDEAAAGSTTNGAYVLPADAGYSISSGWGPRSCSGCSTFHRGVDITNYPGGSKGKPVYSIADGEVIQADKTNGSGSTCAGGGNYGNNYVRIRHSDGSISGYMHMGVGDIKVSVGDQVTAGQQIGAINNCGQSYGAHLHFTMQPGDSTDPAVTAIPVNATYIDPVLYMAARGIDLNAGTYTDGR